MSEWKLITQSKNSSGLTEVTISTEAMEIEGVGCLVRTSTGLATDTGVLRPIPLEEKKAKYGGRDPEYNSGSVIMNISISEALQFIPGVKIVDNTLVKIEVPKAATKTSTRKSTKTVKKDSE